MTFSPALALYLAVTRCAGPVARAVLRARARRGKEDPARLSERLGEPGAPRPDGPLVWLHGASVGEGLSTLGLITALSAQRPDLGFVVTTGTATSARLLAERLPDRAVHQFAPVDLASAARRFLDHWRPGLAVWVESELWPRLIVETAGRAPLALVNARLSERSERGWRRAPGAIRAILSRFDAIAAQTEDTAARLRRLGAPADRVRVTGSIKAGAGGAPDAPEARAALSAMIGGRPVWLAASTHEGEEAAAAEAHRIAARVLPGLLTLIAPRHPERGPEIAASLAAAGLAVALRSRDEPVTPETEVYVADTMGELGAWLRLAGVAFIGGSLAPRGGHNPYEPAAAGAAILHGPHTANFAAEYAALAAAGGARETGDAAALGDAVATLLGDDAARRAMAEAARAALGDRDSALAAVVDLLEPLLPAPAAR